MNHAVCLGEIFIDCFAEQSGLPRSEVSSWEPLPGGAPANVACALAKLGNVVEFVGAVGEDHWGGALVRLLDDMKVGRRGLQYRHKAPTRRVYLTKNDQGDRTFSGFSESDSAHSNSAHSTSAHFADAHLFANALALDLFVNASILVLGTLSLACLDSREAIFRAVKTANSNNVPILIDVNWQPMFWHRPAEASGYIYDLLRQVHFLKVSEAEANWLFGTLSASVIAHQLPHLQGVLITAGANGCQYCFRGVGGHLPAFEVDVEETTGAGDAFTAGFVHQLLQKGVSALGNAETALKMVTYASAVGALTTTRPGAIAALPTPNEIEAFLYLH